MCRDWKNTIVTSVAKAQEEEMERGMKEGREGAAEKREIARNMKANGMDTSLIVQLTGLSEPDVDGL